MADLSPRALTLLRIHARQAKLFGSFPIVREDTKDHQLYRLQQELFDAGLVHAIWRWSGSNQHRRGIFTPKGKAFCRMVGYP